MFVKPILDEELGLIRHAVEGGRQRKVLQWLHERGTAEELVEREYEGRYVFELLQNADDAARSGGEQSTPHRVAFVVTEQSLLIANEGQAFQKEDVKSICTLGESSKDPRKTIGYKGLGFKAVKELTDQPQVISPPYQFAFNTERARKAVTDITGPLPAGQRLPQYAFPFPVRLSDLGKDRTFVKGLLQEGFVTVIRLPYKQGVLADHVLQQLQMAVAPELLLFLDNTSDIEIRWPRGASHISKTAVGELGQGKIIRVSRDGETFSRWLVFRSPPINITKQLVASLDRNWQRIRQVSATVAFALDDQRLAVDQDAKPLHVYFPTDTFTGHSFLIHADFYLDMDRRHISATPNAMPYNKWLGHKLANFVGRTVVPDLVQHYPHDPRIVNVLAPVEPARGVGGHICEQLNDVLKQTRFVPTAAGDHVSPATSILAPVDVDRARDFLVFFPAQSLGGEGKRIVQPSVQEDGRSLHLIRRLGAVILPNAVVLRALRHKVSIGHDDLGRFYALLGHWCERQPQASSPQEQLKRLPLLYTFDDRWVPMTGPAFFSRSPGSPQIPRGFPATILHEACTTGLTAAEEFLKSIGVQPFRWREVILHSLLPTLSGKPTDRQIGAAHQFLKTYFQEEGGDDQTIAGQIGVVPVKAKATCRRRAEWRRADRVYFAHEWLGHSYLEDLYGRFDAVEFLAEQVPDDPAEALAMQKYYRWLGVADRPCVSSVKTERATRYGYELNASLGPAHPHRRSARLWTSYAASLSDYQGCADWHPNSQILSTSYVMDRLDDVLDQPSVKCGTAIVQLLAQHADDFKKYIHAEVRCVHSQHRDQPTHAVPSYIMYILARAKWVPVKTGKVAKLFTPGEVWVPDPGVPSQLRQLIPTFPPDRYPAGFKDVMLGIGFVDPSRARSQDYVTLLRLIPQELPLDAISSIKSETRRRKYKEQVADLARWTMQRLDHALQQSSVAVDGRREWWDIPLLSRANGSLIFAPRPVVQDDHRLGNLLRGRLTFFEGDRGWSHLIRAFSLPRLSRLVTAEPVPGMRLYREEREIADRVDGCLPYLLALVRIEAPSELNQAKGRLSRFELQVVDRLDLQVTIRGTSLQEILVEEASYLQEARREGSGPITMATATYYCVKAAASNYYLLGSAVAGFLGKPALGDACAILLLKTSRDERLRFLHAKGGGIEDVKAARELLGRGDDEDNLGFPFGSHCHEREMRRVGGRGADIPESAASSPGYGAHGGGDSSHGRAARRENPPLPNLDAGNLHVVREGFAPPRASRGQQEHSGRSSGSRSVDWAALEETRRLYGRRGEEAAYQAERNRLIAAGGDPERVRWVSRDIETADHDLESVGEDGKPIYIEVKTTSSDDPGEAFPISAAELLCAAKHQEYYFIYRVTRVRDVVPRITAYAEPLNLVERGLATLDFAQGRMRLPPSALE